MYKPINSSYLFTGLAICVALGACGGGSDGHLASVLDNSLSKDTLIATNILEKGQLDCANGGVNLDIGPDKDGDGNLSAEEVTQTRIICNGAQGLTNLIRIYDEPIGRNCASGGKIIQVGQDFNFDKELTADEVSDTQFLCDTDEPEVTHNSLVSIVEEPAGENCATGGGQIKTGLDSNNNGILDENETTESSYICNGTAGVAGQVTRSLQSINCSGPLENMNEILWSYEIHQLTSGDAVVTASVYNSDTTVGSLAFYSGQELADGVKPAVNFIYDVVAENNYGLWSIYLDESQGKAFVVYNDIDQTTNPGIWSMTTDNCTTTVFE